MPKFLVSNGLVDYDQAIDTMQKIVKDVQDGCEDTVWFLEHPEIYTAGTSAKSSDLLEESFPVHQTSRGGQYTYHGPGQLIAYVMVDLKKRNNDIRKFVYNLEEWVIQILRNFDIQGKRKNGRIGVWLDDKNVERKIAAIGVRVTKGITWHGLALNVNPNLEHFNGIIPCGLKEYKTTSLKAEGIETSVQEVTNLMQLCANTCGIWNDL